MAKCRIGHFVEAQVKIERISIAPPSHNLIQILQAIGVDYIDESEVLSPADEQVCIDIIRVIFGFY